MNPTSELALEKRSFHLPTTCWTVPSKESDIPYSSVSLPNALNDWICVALFIMRECCCEVISTVAMKTNGFFQQDATRRCGCRTYFMCAWRHLSKSQKPSTNCRYQKVSANSLSSMRCQWQRRTTLPPSCEVIWLLLKVVVPARIIAKRLLKTVGSISLILLLHCEHPYFSDILINVLFCMFVGITAQNNSGVTRSSFS